MATRARTSPSRRAATGEAGLEIYRDKRRFAETPEPRGRKARRRGWSYVIQKHDATRLHYDFRLELDGVLKSWAVTRGPSLDPGVKRLAIRTEDHPLDYGGFEGIIPKGNYGAGTVMLWDRGTWQPDGDPHEGLAKGKLAFRLDGERLKGGWALVRFRPSEGNKEAWLLIKEVDEYADPERDVLEAFGTSVESGRDLDAIASDKRSKRHKSKKPASRAPRKRSPARKPARRALPPFVKPALATLVDKPPRGDDWLFEIKLDGYRTMVAASGDEVRCYTRSGLDWTHRFGGLAESIAALDLDGALLDGEVVAVDDVGRTDFSALQDLLRHGGAGMTYFVFDLLFAGGEDLRKRPLRERKERLRALLGRSAPGGIFFVDHIEGNGKAMLTALCRKKLEGIVAKRADSLYRSGRGHAWLKIKCGYDQEFVVVGYTPSMADRPFASLMLGLNEKGQLRYVGRVGSGFNRDDMAELSRRFPRLRRASAPVSDVPLDAGRIARWLEPRLVAQVAFAGFTGDGLVRQARYIGLREDKPPARIRRERPSSVEEAIR